MVTIIAWRNRHRSSSSMLRIWRNDCPPTDSIDVVSITLEWEKTVRILRLEMNQAPSLEMDRVMVMIDVKHDGIWCFEGSN